MDTLCLIEPGSYLKRFEETLSVVHPDGWEYKASVDQIDGIILLGYSQQSKAAIGFAHSRHIPILFLHPNGTYLGRLEPEPQQRVHYLPHQQQCARNPEFRQMMAQSITRAQLYNQSVLLGRLRGCGLGKPIQSARDAIARLMDNLPMVDSVRVLRCYQRRGSAYYVRALMAGLIPWLSLSPMHCCQGVRSGFAVSNWKGSRLSRHPIHCLFSLGYLLLNHHIYALLSRVGLHSHWGNLHIHRDHCPALVADFMAEFTVALVDALVVDLWRWSVFSADDFTVSDGGDEVYLTVKGIEKFITYWQKQLPTRITHLPTGCAVSYVECLELQVQGYIACLLGDKDDYQPFVSKP